MQIKLFHMFTVELTLLLRLLILEPSLLIPCANQVCMCCVEAIICFFQFIISHLRNLLKFVSSFLKLKQIKISGFNSLVVVTVFMLLFSDTFTHTVNFELVSGPFVFHFL